MQGGQTALQVPVFSGVDEHWVADPASAVILQDAQWDPRGGWEICGGTAKILPDVQGVNPFTGAGAVSSMHWFSQHNGGPQFLIFEIGTDLVYFDGSLSGQRWRVIATNRYTTSQPWQGTQYAAIGNNVWIINGEDPPLRFDGRYAHRAGFTAPAPNASVQGLTEGFSWGTSGFALGLGTAMTAATDGGGEYAYIRTEVNAFGTESPPTPACTSVAWKVAFVGGVGTQPKYFTCLADPAGSSDYVTESRPYRTQNAAALGLMDGSRFFQVASLPGTTAGNYVDGLPDQYLGPECVPSNYGPWPRGAKFIKVYKGRIFLAGMPSDPDLLVYSRVDQIENFPPANFFRIGNRDSGEVTGMYEARNCLFVTQRRGISIILVNQAGELEQRVISPDKGAASGGTIRDVPGIGVVFASDDGVWAITGSIQDGDAPVDVIPISQQLVDFWNWRVNKPALANARAEVYHAKGEYWLSVPIDGNPRNRMVLVYHYLRNAWSFRPDLNVGCMAETHDHRGYLFIGSNDATGHPGVHVYSGGYSTKDGVAKSFVYRSAQWSREGGYSHVHVSGVRARIITYGQHPLTLNVYKDRLPTVANPVQTRLELDNDYKDSDPVVLPVWGTAKWALTDTWGRAVPTVVRWDVNTKGAKEFQYELSTSHRVQVLGAEVQVTNPQTRSVEVLNPIIGTGTE